MDIAPNELICKCKKVTLADIDRALHDSEKFADVERQFAAVQKITHCSTGCGGCHDKIMNVISDLMHG